MKRTSLLSAFACSGALLLVGCGDTPPSECTTVSTGMTEKFRVTQLLVPTAPDKYDFDINDPSGRDRENQLGAVIQILKSNMLDAQSGIDEQVNGYKVNLGVSVTSANLTNDNCGGANLTILNAWP